MPSRRDRILVLAGLVLVALSLRSAATAVSPLLDDLRADIGIGTGGIGLLGLLPPTCFAVVGAVTPAIGRRFGLERTLVASLLISAVGSATRPLAGDTPTFLVLSAVTLSGMAMGNVLLPPLVKRHFPGQIGAVTSAYVVLVSLGAALPPYTDVPLEAAFGWRVALGAWALVAVLAILPWLTQLRRTAAERSAAPRTRIPVLRSRRAWGLTVLFAMTSLNVYSLFAWLPEILVDAGVTRASAGLLLGLYATLGIPPSLVMPIVTARMANPFPLILLFAAFFLIGYGGLLFNPGSMTWLWVVMAGLGPSSFPMSLTMINLRTTSPAGSAGLSGMVQGIGYAIAGGGPLVFGLLHDGTGAWNASLLLLCGTVLVSVVAGWFACRPGTVEAELGLLVPAGDQPGTQVPTRTAP